MIVLLALPFVFFLSLLLLVPYRWWCARRLLSDCSFPILSPSFFSLPSLLSSQSFQLFGELSKQHGVSTYGVVKGRVAVVVTSDVEVIHQVCVSMYSHMHSHGVEGSDVWRAEDAHLFSSRGERWKRLRSIMSTAFTPHAMRQWESRMIEHASALVHSLPCDVDVDVHRTMQTHASSVMGDCAFSFPAAEPWRNVVQHFGQPATFTCTQALSYYLPELSWIFDKIASLLHPQLSHPLDKFTSFLRDEAAERGNDEETFDLLQLLKKAEGEVAEGEGGKEVFKVANVTIGKRISTKELSSQLRFVSIAGYDTTANTLTLLLWLLAQHEDAMGRLVQEVDSVPHPFLSLPHLPFLNACIYETLRLYPHASPLQSRECCSTVTLPSGYRIRKGVQVVIDTWSLHRNPQLWGEDANEFRPERFLSDYPKEAFMPFGIGPRQCVGMRFALLEMRVAVVVLLRALTLTVVSGETVQMSLRDTNTIWPQGIIMQFHPRNFEKRETN